MRSRKTSTVLAVLFLAALPAVAPAQQDDDRPFLRIQVPEEGEDRIHRLRAQVRHTTVIVLPPDENILDLVAGDAEYWTLTGAANVAFLKPLAPDVATNIALVCESGRIYSFLVAEQSDALPHLVVRAESGPEETGLAGCGRGEGDPHTGFDEPGVKTDLWRRAMHRRESVRRMSRTLRAPCHPLTLPVSFRWET